MQLFKIVSNHGNTVTGAQGADWQYAQVDTGIESGGDYILQFRAVVGGAKGDIALDDVKLTPGACVKGQWPGQSIYTGKPSHMLLVMLLISCALDLKWAGSLPLTHNILVFKLPESSTK